VWSGDATRRAVTTHIGVLAEAFRQQSWSGARPSLDLNGKPDADAADADAADDDDAEGENYLTLSPEQHV
jgi:hypothetical protein